MNTDTHIPEEQGGPAFPSLYPRSDEDGKQGMSMRDYFAGQAITAIIANRSFILNEDGMALMAERSYDLANAMLKARKKKP